MIEVTNRALDETIEIGRILGKYKGEKEGPVIVFIGGTHGNETSSIFALSQVFEYLNRLQPSFSGEVIAAFAGNLEALDKGVRWIDNDMNRIWVTDRLQKLGFIDERNLPVGNEQKQQKELLDILNPVFDQADGPVFVFDLHTTSSVSPPFIGASDTIRNRQLALQYPLPCVVGFDEAMRGTFMNYINERGHSGVALEAGEHYSMAAVENNISFIWHTLKILGSMEKNDIPKYNIHYQRLCRSLAENRKIFDLKFTYKIGEDEKFQMRSGYATFDKVKKGEILADNQYGEIKAPYSGRIFMPLYQSQGDDGFFIIREISEFKLDLSRYLRTHNLGRYLRYLPGIKKHPDDENTIMVHPILNKKFFHDFLHAFGYRRKMLKDGSLIITRRKFDVRIPTKEEKMAFKESNGQQEDSD
ncbi:succinylglutamate desuccinylase/aspartoacylase family protein [Rhodohalobacter mucosus]|uniref:Succinylglutamate desuccinylase/Aspartoacylase catalytic domain-containing protein n=1 Tax=Rhodohalobacter mucosus TaxID=2079485 RepID=A0A316TUJ8_9BACT|nr:succinylglutamate desuccinylase/aspartoacylase family protein [Rhodohalobacter mucosus]PWN08177.1 hypothetical protein DDZ15_00655 [Rhodohalobacter mucosus]